ncbi:MAG: thioesterase family protein [Pseudomonadota bacterium]
MGLKTKTEATVRLTVPFYDLDAFEVVWHGNYLKYFSRARRALFEQAGVELYPLKEEVPYLLPIVRWSVKHTHPLALGDEFDCTARLVEADTKIVVKFEIRLVSDNTLCARAHSEQVAIRRSDRSIEFEIPAEIRQAFGLN